MAIDNIEILYNTTNDDHIPFLVHLNAEIIPKVTNETNDLITKINWNNLKDSELQKYHENTCETLEQIIFPTDAISCKNLKYNNESHRQDLIGFYNSITDALNKAGSHLNSNGNKGYVQRPGWTEHVSDLYDYSKTCRQLWLDSNETRQGPIHDNYVRSRARFKYALRYITKNEDQMRKEALARNLSNKKTTEFWKEISVANNCKTPLPDNIEKANGPTEIAELWKNHFQEIFNCLRTKEEHSISDNLEDTTSNISISPCIVKDAIKELGLNKSCGLDGIMAEHLKYASQRLHYLLSMCLTGFFIHGFLPESMMSVLIVPVIKDKAGNINAKDNYRPIALANIISKIVEIIMLDRMKTHLLTQPNQFGYKKKHGTDQCIFAIKEPINACKSKGSCVYTCFLDASKAFDRLNHTKLFRKLSERGIPGYLLRLLVFWYSKQTMCIRWG